VNQVVLVVPVDQVDQEDQEDLGVREGLVDRLPRADPELLENQQHLEE
jgi:hypothetical protein